MDTKMKIYLAIHGEVFVSNCRYKTMAFVAAKGKVIGKKLSTPTSNAMDRSQLHILRKVEKMFAAKGKVIGMKLSTPQIDADLNSIFEKIPVLNLLQSIADSRGHVEVTV
jgi:hypothetical protein